MAGRNFLNMLDSIGALALNIGLNIVLIPHFGILGSAIAWTAALVAIGAIRLLQVRRYVVDRLPYNADVIKAVVAGCAALAVGLVLRQFLGGVGLLAAATLAVCATYAIVLMLFGLPADDRAVAIAMRSRLRQRVAA
jgi:O-antigen/teichoic acid export membrane protein